MIFIGETARKEENSIQFYLENANFEAETFADAEEFFNKLKTGNSPDLFILTRNFIKENGSDLIKKTREEYKSNAPAIVVSEPCGEQEIINGFALGADDFLEVPFSPEILIAHVKAHLRRAKISSETENCIKFGEYSLLTDGNVIKKGNTKIPISEKEYKILEYMAENDGKILSAEQIYKNVWKTKFGDITAVAVYIQRLRKKIEENPSKPAFIKTVFGQSYCFDKNGGTGTEKFSES